MTDYGSFHDGALKGVWVDDEVVYVFLSTVAKERFVAVANGVVALALTKFKKGNLIFEVAIRGYQDVTTDDIAMLYDLREGEEGIEQADKLLAKVRQEQLSLFEIIPSYGATFLLLAHSIDIVEHNDWLVRYLSSASRRPI
jgi:hypothetical protein